MLNTYENVSRQPILNGTKTIASVKNGVPEFVTTRSGSLSSLQIPSVLSDAITEWSKIPHDADSAGIAYNAERIYGVIQAIYNSPLYTGTMNKTLQSVGVAGQGISLLAVSSLGDINVARSLLEATLHGGSGWLAKVNGPAHQNFVANKSAIYRAIREELNDSKNVNVKEKLKSTLGGLPIGGEDVLSMIANAVVGKAPKFNIQGKVQQSDFKIEKSGGDMNAKWTVSYIDKNGEPKEGTFLEAFIEYYGDALGKSR
jgi:hypothetical protein